MSFHFKPVFEQALPYQAFLAKHGSEENRQRWAQMYEKISLKPEQRQLLDGFQRPMHVLCMAGPWCGDCVNACPIFQKIAEASPRIDLRFINRSHQFNPDAADVETVVANELSICGAPRVPMLVFLSEDWYECGRFGERTLATYRNKVMHTQGVACPTGLFAPPEDLLAANVAEWLGHFERIELMLLTSPRLMQMHQE